MIKTLGLAAAAIVIILVMMMFQIKMRIRDKIYCLFITDNKQLVGKLVKPKSETLPLGTGKDQTKYLASKERQFKTSYPPGFPSILQEPVQGLLFVQGNAEPINLFNTKSLLTALTLMKISDEAMLMAMWRDVRESVGLKGGGLGSKMELLILIASVTAAICSAIVLMRTGGIPMP
jgi:hypothetical protein